MKSGAMKRCLIVDDQETNVYLLECLLKANGYSVESAIDGAEALEIAKHNPPDMIITDILMPVMDGYALCREWKANEALKHIPLIFYTATYTDPNDKTFALSLGADRFIVKPQEPEVLMRIIQEVLDNAYEAKQVAARPFGEEMEIFRQHNEILFKKLEKKMSDLEAANQQLQKLEERYRLTFHHVTDVIYTIDSDLRVSSVSPSVEKIWGYKPEDIVGRSVSDWVHMVSPESFQRVVDDIMRILRGETISSAIYDFVARDGTIRIGEVSGSPIIRDGRIIGLISVARDITERIRTGEALKVREKELENKTHDLEEAVTALKVLLKQREEDRTELEEQLVANLRELTLPYLQDLKESSRNEELRRKVDQIEKSLNEIASPFLRRLKSLYATLTPREIQIADLVKDGRTTKEIASILNTSVRAVEFHRDSLRRKCGLTNRRASLHSHLQTLA